MIATIVHVSVKPEFVSAFKQASRENAAASRQEPGNVSFDVLQNDADPNAFVLYEAYETKEAALAHKQTAHYLMWRDTVAPMMAEPRRGISYTEA